MSYLAELRSIIPTRRLAHHESLILAERQSLQLRQLLDVAEPALPTMSLTELPFLKVTTRAALASSAATKWIKPHWVVLLNASETEVRQRLSLAHEFKHILDHGRVADLYGDIRDPNVRRRVERLCDYFAGCLLAPRPWLKRAYASGIQSPAELAEVFDMSVSAMEVRLKQIGIHERYERRRPLNNIYFRSRLTPPVLNNLGITSADVGAVT